MHAVSQTHLASICHYSDVCNPRLHAHAHKNTYHARPPACWLLPDVQWSSRRGYTSLGFDLAYATPMTLMSAEHCKQECTWHPGCKAITFAPDSGRCVFKSCAPVVVAASSPNLETHVMAMPVDGTICGGWAAAVVTCRAGRHGSGCKGWRINDHGGS